MLYRRVLITGANGLLGQELVYQMSERPEYDVLATGRDPEPRTVGTSSGYVPLDITETDDVQHAFEDFAPDVVINCAAMTQVDRCEEERETCWEVNVDAVEHLARQCYLHGARLVQLSTDFVFDGEEGPYREDARPDPVNYYGKSKQAAENITRDAGINNWAIARTVLVYGTGRDLPRSNIALWVIDQLTSGEEIHVVTDQYRSPTYVCDLADGIERLVRFDKRGIYHLSGREVMSVYDFAQTIAQVFDLDASLIHPTDRTEFQQTAERPLKTGFIILKAETELGYKPRSVEHALRHLGAALDLPVSTS